MEDLIRRQDAIDAILHNEDIYSHHYSDDAIDRYTVAIINNDAQTIAQLPSAQQWTPCSEGLPRKNGRYLVTRGLNACGSLWNRTYIANYSDLMGLISEKIWWQGNVGKSDFEQLDDVLAWMPLPEPWKGESNE